MDQIQQYEKALQIVEIKVRTAKNPECWVKLWTGLRDEMEVLKHQKMCELKVVFLKQKGLRPA